MDVNFWKLIDLFLSHGCYQLKVGQHCLQLQKNLLGQYISLVQQLLQYNSTIKPGILLSMESYQLVQPKVQIFDSLYAFGVMGDVSRGIGIPLYTA